MFCLFPLSLNQNKKSSNYFSEAAIVSSLLLAKTRMKNFYAGFTIQTKYLSSSNIKTSRLRIFWGMSWIVCFSCFILHHNWYSIVSSSAKQRKRGKRQRDEETEISDGPEQRLARLEQRGEQQRGQQRAEQRLERNQLWGSARDVASSCKRLHTDQQLRSEPVEEFSLTDKKEFELFLKPSKAEIFQSKCEHKQNSGSKLWCSLKEDRNISSLSLFLWRRQSEETIEQICEFRS